MLNLDNFVNLKINLICIRYPQLSSEEITEITRLNIDPQIKNTHCEY